MPENLVKPSYIDVLAGKHFDRLEDEKNRIKAEKTAEEEARRKKITYNYLKKKFPLAGEIDVDLLTENEINKIVRKSDMLDIAFVLSCFSGIASIMGLFISAAFSGITALICAGISVISWTGFFTFIKLDDKYFHKYDI